MLDVSWSEIKRHADLKAIPMQWVEVGDNYHIVLVDGPFHLYCVQAKSASTEFEASYKAAGNKAVQQLPSAYSAKTVGNKKLFARNTGYKFNLATGINELSITAIYPWAKIVGIEIINCEALDTAELRVYDTAAGTYSGVPNYLLNQFGYAINLPKDFYSRMSPYDADLYQGMVLKVSYDSVSAKTIGINIIMSEVK